MKVKVVACTTHVDRNGNSLSISQLRDLAETAIGRPIGVNFNPFIPPVGKVIGAEVQDNKLLIEAEIPDNEFGCYFISPSYSIDINTRAVTSLDYALTREHSDEDATQISNVIGQKFP